VGRGHERGLPGTRRGRATSQRDLLRESVHIVVYTDWEEFYIVSVWTTAEAADAEDKRLSVANKGEGVYSVYEYALDTPNGEAE
jgi:hypothetical protein